MKKNDIVIGVCEGYTYDAHGVVKIDGFPLFVKGLLKNEKAEIIVTMLKKSYGYGRIRNLISISEDRVEPPCPLAKQCGGCQLQHMAKCHQAQFKKEQVENVLRRIAHTDVVVNDVLMMEEPWHYRNKAQIPFQIEGDRVISGFYRIHSNTIIDMNECMIQHPMMNRVLQVVKQRLQMLHTDGVGALRHLLIKYASSSDEVMVVFITADAQALDWKVLVEALCEEVPQVKSILLNINQRDDNVILGDHEILLYGTPYISDRLFDLDFRIAVKSFYQVNVVQTEVLYRTVMDFAQLTGNEVVLDCYCGVGTIALCLARWAKQVIGIEIVPQAIDNAVANAKRNQIENVRFVCADAKDYAKTLSDARQSVDVVVVDPPRKGCDAQVLESIASMGAGRIVYVSCNAATLARDIERLKEYGYHAAKVQPVDMFPQTQHVEVVCLLSKLRANQNIEVELTMSEMDLTAAESKSTYEEIKDYVLKHSGMKVK